jgi:hypothetical protein
MVNVRRSHPPEGSRDVHQDVWKVAEDVSKVTGSKAMMIIDKSVVDNFSEATARTRQAVEGPRLSGFPRHGRME